MAKPRPVCSQCKVYFVTNEGDICGTCKRQNERLKEDLKNTPKKKPKK